MNGSTPGEIKIAKRFKAFRQSIMTTWESYTFLNFGLDFIDKEIKAEKFPQFELEHLSNLKTGKDYKRHFDKKTLLGVVDHLIKKLNPERAILEPVAYIESYLQDLCEFVYKDYPERLLGKDSEKNNSEQDKQQGKLLGLIIKSIDRDEIIDKIIEEKIRGIFYGNPLDFYIKDKANIGIGDYFKNNHQNTIKILAEIVARRNIYVHNQGRVDNKYLKEVENPMFRFNEKAKLDEDYIRESIIILRGFAAVVTKLVIENTYKKKCTNATINDNSNSFIKSYK